MRDNLVFRKADNVTYKLTQWRPSIYTDIDMEEKVSIVLGIVSIK